MNTSISNWLMERPEFLALYLNNAIVHAVAKTAELHGWSVEKFLELAVCYLADHNTALTDAICKHNTLSTSMTPIIVSVASPAATPSESE